MDTLTPPIVPVSQGDTEMHKWGIEKPTGWGHRNAHRGEYRDAQVRLTDRLTERGSYRSSAHLTFGIS